jgi:hypothetical protein
MENEDDVKVLKLVTGEEIVTTMTKGEGEFLLLNRPVKIQWDAQNPNNIGLIPWVFAGVVEEVTLESRHVLIIVDASPPTKQHYCSTISEVFADASSAVAEGVAEGDDSTKGYGGYIQDGGGSESTY